MSECVKPDCPVQGPHEHRRQQYSIEVDCFWYELRAREVQLLEEIMAAYKLPKLVFAMEQLPSPAPPAPEAT